MVVLKHAVPFQLRDKCMHLERTLRNLFWTFDIYALKSDRRIFLDRMLIVDSTNFGLLSSGAVLRCKNKCTIGIYSVFS